MSNSVLSSKIIRIGVVFVINILLIGNFTSTSQAQEVNYVLPEEARNPFLSPEPFPTLNNVTTGDEQIIRTGKSKAAAVAFSALPGAGQFYNGDIALGVIFSSLALGVVLADAVIPSNSTNPILIGIPLLSVISMIHAGVTVNEEYSVQ